MRETNNRRAVDSGVKCGMCDFCDGGGVVSEWNIASDCIPELNGQDGVQVLAACDYGDGVFTT